MSKKNTKNLVSLKELREHFPEYIEEVAKGRSFTVVKRSQPIFQITPVADEGDWESVINFTDIDPKGVTIDELLKHL